MSFDTNQLAQFDVGANINNLHNIIHNINQHRIWWKTALLAALGFIGLGFVLIWVLYAVNENRTQEFNALIYSSAVVLIFGLIVMGILFFLRDTKEAGDFGDRLTGYINGLKNEMNKQQIVAQQQLQEQRKQTARAMRATDILAERNKEAALGAADKYVF